MNLLELGAEALPVLPFFSRLTCNDPVVLQLNMIKLTTVTNEHIRFLCTQVDLRYGGSRALFLKKLDQPRRSYVAL